MKAVTENINCPTCSNPQAQREPATIKNSKARRWALGWIIAGVLMVACGAPLYLFMEGSPQPVSPSAVTQTGAELENQEKNLSRGIDSGRSKASDYSAPHTAPKLFAVSAMVAGALMVGFGSISALGHRTVISCPTCKRADP